MYHNVHYIYIHKSCKRDQSGSHLKNCIDASAESQDASPNEGRQRVKDGSGSRSILLLPMTSEPTNHLPMWAPKKTWLSWFIKIYTGRANYSYFLVSIVRLELCSPI